MNRCDTCRMPRERHIDSRHDFYSRDEERAKLEAAEKRAADAEHERDDAKNAFRSAWSRAADAEARLHEWGSDECLKHSERDALRAQLEQERANIAESRASRAESLVETWKANDSEYERAYHEAKAQLADTETEDELARLKEDIEEHIPEYVLDDGTNDEANHRERIEYAGFEIDRLRAQLAEAMQADKSAYASQMKNQARMLTDMDEQNRDLRVQLAEAELSCKRLQDAREVLRSELAEVASSETHAAWQELKAQLVKSEAGAAAMRVVLERAGAALSVLEPEADYEQRKKFIDADAGAATAERMARLEKWKAAAMKAYPAGFSCVRLLSRLYDDCDEAGIVDKCPQCSLNDCIQEEHEARAGREPGAR